ncbi:MAG: corrinoid protein [Oscillospiraceae bacterium]|nr:corrinoid protein [Oscillospiraceae bacterium]
MSKLEEVAAAVEKGKVKIVAGLTQEALDEGFSAAEILNTGMIGAMAVVGEKFKNNEIFVPEMLIAARAMKKGVEVLTPYLKAAGTESKGKLILGTVAGDLHDIGKNLVGMMIEGAGFEVIDLGVDVPAEKFIECMKENPDCKIVALSALLTTTMPAIKSTIDAIVAAGLRDTVKIMIGGAPVTQAFADEVGADGYSEDAASAAELANKLKAEWDAA